MKKLSMLTRLFMLTALFTSGAAIWAVATPAWAQLPPPDDGDWEEGHDHEGDDEFEEEDDFEAPITGSIKASRWNTKFRTDGDSTPYKGTLRFNDDEGTYKTVDGAGDPIVRELHDVRYIRSGGVRYISGEFPTDPGQGLSFRFTLDDDLQSFEGTWKHDDGRTGRWNGVRTRK